MKLLFLFLLLFHSAISNGQEKSLTVIAHINGAPNGLTLYELKSIFKGEINKWADGGKVTIAMIKPSVPLGKIICDKLYNMSPDKVMRFWLGLQFAGKVDPPVFFQTIEELEAFVAKNPGAIGIIDRDEVAPNIKVILVDKKRTF